MRLTIFHNPEPEPLWENSLIKLIHPFSYDALTQLGDVHVAVFNDGVVGISVSKDNETGEYVVEGPRIEKMLGYTNLDSEKGFAFFQKFLKETGILKELEKLGIEEGNTVRMYGLSFDYYKSW